MKNQISFFDDSKTLKRKYGRVVHGGSASVGRRKEQRPLSTKHPIHLVFKSAVAKGSHSFLASKHKSWIEQLVYLKARKFGVRIDQYVNAGDHLHIQLRLANRAGFQSFLRSVSSLIARKVTGARKGKPFGKFWQALAFTRVLKTKFEHLQLKGYFKANWLQVRNSYQAREKFLKQFNQQLYGLRYGDSS